MPNVIGLGPCGRPTRFCSFEGLSDIREHRLDYASITAAAAPLDSSHQLSPYFSSWSFLALISMLQAFGAN